MSALAAALTTRALGRIATAVATPGGIRTWLLKGGFFFGEESTSEAIVLHRVNVSEYFRYLCFDYERFALSSWESFSLFRLERVGANALGWPLLKLYYAGFFAAHSLMRATGEAMIHIEKGHAGRLTEFAQLVVGPTFVMTAGMYHMRTIQGEDGSVDVRLTKQSDTGRAHELFWKAFTEFLGRIETEVVERSEPNAGQVVGEVADLLAIMRAGGALGGTWLSGVRNKINYQHEYEVWFPVSRKHPGFASVDAANFKPTSAIRLDVNPSKAPLDAFAGASHYLTSLSFDVAEHVAGNAPGATQFGGKWRRLRQALSDGTMTQPA